ncbi:MAG: hypothetical protein ACPGCM_05515, partial [Alteromonas oceani]
YNSLPCRSKTNHERSTAPKDDEEIAYPNNLVLTRPVIINPKQHWQGIGKSTDKHVDSEPKL